MKSSNRSLPAGILLAALAAVFVLVLPATANAAFPGAVYTTDSTGTSVDQNLYAKSTDVYLNGGPQNDHFSGLPDGTYYFQVTDPSGLTLLSTDNATCRQLTVTNGRVSGAAGPCPHLQGAFNPANNSRTVQLAPFSASPNAAGEYKVWLIAQTATTSISASDPKVIVFQTNDSKTDNFKVQQQVVPPPQGSCLPTSSLSVLIQGCNVSAYVPRGSWSEFTPGVKVVTVEGSGLGPTIISTPNPVNSCATNSLTGETVCTSNGTDVYLITGTTLNTTLTSGATAAQSFSGGSCMTCGVAMDPSTNHAILSVGVNVGGPGGFQFVDLGTSTAGAVVPAGFPTSEDISVDPIRHLVLSPNEDANYQILQTQPAVALYNNTTNPPPLSVGEMDSACEDCLTGIALATVEAVPDLHAPPNIFLTDLNQATFTPGIWSTPAAGSNLQAFPEFSAFNFGTSGIAVAPGSHLAIVTGEFGGNNIGVLQLPAAAGGTPAAVDWVAATVPGPDSIAWNMGRDPHTVTAYVSPCSGKAIGLMANAERSFLAVVDLQCLLSGPRLGHVSTSPGSCISFVPLPGPFPQPGDAVDPTAGRRARAGGVPESYDHSPGGGHDAAAFELRAVVPNPLHTTQTTAYALPLASHVTLGVYDVRGRLTRMLVDEFQSAGMHQTVWDGTDERGSRVPVGMYFLRLNAGTRSAMQKVIVASR